MWDYQRHLIRSNPFGSVGDALKASMLPLMQTFVVCSFPNGGGYKPTSSTPALPSELAPELRNYIFFLRLGVLISKGVKRSIQQKSLT